MLNPLPDAAKAMRLIAPLSRLRPSLAACLVLVASASFIPLPAPSQPVEATPHVEAVTVGDDAVEVSLAGPSAVKAGDFVIVAIASATEGAELTFGYTPDPGAAKRAVFEEPGTGRRLIVFIQPPEGKYRVSLLGQIAKDGKDPAAFAVHDVTVGKVTPDPDDGDDDDDDPVVPDLKGFSFAVYNAAKGLDKATVAQAAGAYGSQVSAINAGAYNALPIEQAKDSIAKSIADANPPRQSAVALFDLIDGELQRREEAGQLGNLTAVSTVLAEITAGLEAVTK